MRTQLAKWSEIANMQIGNSGVALDEAILAGAMLTSVGLFAAVSVPWENVFPGGEAQRMKTELETLEEANESFYQYYRRWPHQMTDGSGTHNAAALVTRRALRHPFRSMQVFNAPLRDVPFDLQGQRVVLRHQYGAGGAIEQQPSDKPGYRMKIVYKDMPISKMKDLDERVDGVNDLYAGRVRVAARADGGLDMVYYANPTKTAHR